MFRFPRSKKPRPSLAPPPSEGWGQGEGWRVLLQTLPDTKRLRLLDVLTGPEPSSPAAQRRIAQVLVDGADDQALRHYSRLLTGLDGPEQALRLRRIAAGELP